MISREKSMHKVTRKEGREAGNVGSTDTLSVVSTQRALSQIYYKNI